MRAIVVNGAVAERNDYTAFGARRLSPWHPRSASNRFTFNGKEAQTIGNLPVLDYGARMFVLRGFPTFTSGDPLGEDRRGLTPFSYAGNDPINLVDWMGLAPQKPEKEGVKETNQGEAGENLSGWGAIGKSIQLNVSVGLQFGGNVELGSTKINAEANVGSIDIVNVNGLYNTEISSGKQRRGAGIGIGAISYDTELVAEKTGKDTATGTTTTSFNIIGIMDARSVTTQYSYRDRIIPSMTKTKYEIAPAQVGFGVKMGIGIDLKVDTKLFIKGVDDLTNKKNIK